MIQAGDMDISLRGVARAAGVSTMAPDHHFPDKAALIGAVAISGFDVLRQALKEADRFAGDEERALIAQSVAYVGLAGDHMALFRLMFADRLITTLAPNCDTDAYGVLTNRVASLGVHDGETTALACGSIAHELAMLTLDARTPNGAKRAELFDAILSSPIQCRNPCLKRCNMR